MTSNESQTSGKSKEDKDNKKSKNKGKAKEDRYIANDNQHLEQILSELVYVGDVFGAEALKEVPEFTPRCKCCIHWHSKRFCFGNCGMKESHQKMSSKTPKAYYI